MHHALAVTVLVTRESCAWTALQVNAEERVAVQEIVEQLEHLDATLRVLEQEGRKLEDRIRMCMSNPVDSCCFCYPPVLHAHPCLSCRISSITTFDVVSGDAEMEDGDLMMQWFEIVNQKNELVRKETDLMFRYIHIWL